MQFAFISSLSIGLTPCTNRIKVRNKSDEIPLDGTAYKGRLANCKCPLYRTNFPVVICLPFMVFQLFLSYTKTKNAFRNSVCKWGIEIFKKGFMISWYHLSSLRSFTSYHRLNTFEAKDNSRRRVYPLAVWFHCWQGRRITSVHYWRNNSANWQISPGESYPFRFST